MKVGVTPAPAGYHQIESTRVCHFVDHMHNSRCRQALQHTVTSCICSLVIRLDCRHDERPPVP